MWQATLQRSVWLTESLNILFLATELPSSYQSATLLNLSAVIILSLWRLPLTRFQWRDFMQEHGVYLFQGFAVGLRQEEVDDEYCCQVAACEDIAVRKSNIACDEGCEEGEEEVE